jgi:hypothetical protein
MKDAVEKFTKFMAMYEPYSMTDDEVAYVSGWFDAYFVGEERVSGDMDYRDLVHYGRGFDDGGKAWCLAQ